jgi:hypothetical protein
VNAGHPAPEPGPRPERLTAPADMTAPGPGAERDGGGRSPDGRVARRAARSALRPTRAVPAFLTALVLLVAGVVTAIEVISALLGRPLRLVPYDTVAGWARSTPWNDTRAMAVAGALALLGLLLLLIALVPGRGRMVALRTGDPDLVIAMPRRALAGRLSRVAREAPGVRRARARIRGSQVDVRARTDLRDTATVSERVRQAVDGELERLAPLQRPRVHVRVRGPA